MTTLIYTRRIPLANGGVVVEAWSPRPVERQHAIEGPHRGEPQRAVLIPLNAGFNGEHRHGARLLAESQGWDLQVGGDEAVPGRWLFRATMPDPVHAPGATDTPTTETFRREAGLKSAQAVEDISRYGAPPGGWRS